LTLKTKVIKWIKLLIFFYLMDIKAILKSNDITQQEFADYMGYTRQSLSGTLKEGKERKSLINSLKLILLEKRGVSIDLAI